MKDNTRHKDLGLQQALDLIQEFDELVIKITKKIDITTAKLPANVPKDIRNHVTQLIALQITDGDSHTAGSANALLKILCVSAFAKDAADRDD